MIELYRRNGGAPVELPAIIYDADDNAFTPPYDDETLAALGFALAPKRPSETATQTVEWGGTKWVMVDRPPAPEPEPAPVPEVVTMRQARLALIEAGLLTRADEAIAAMPGKDGEKARVEWEYATSLRRDHPLVAAIGTAFGLTEEAKDDLFILADTL